MNILNFKEDGYKEKNISFFNLLKEALKNNYKEYNVTYISMDVYNDDAWFDDICIEDKQGNKINKIPFPVFCEIIGIKINKTDWDLDSFENNNLLKAINEAKKYCNIIKDTEHIKKETKEFLENNKDSLDEKINIILKGKSITNINADDTSIWYDEDCDVFIKGMYSCHTEEVISIKYLLENLKDYKIA